MKINYHNILKYLNNQNVGLYYQCNQSISISFFEKLVSRDLTKQIFQTIRLLREHISEENYPGSPFLNNASQYKNIYEYFPKKNHYK